MENIISFGQYFPVVTAEVSYLQTPSPALLLLLPLAVQAMQYQAVPAPAAPAAPYSYQYGVKDDYTKTNFAKTEARDSNVSCGPGRQPECIMFTGQREGNLRDLPA